MEKPIVTKEVRYALDYLFSKIAGHSDYHGDDILSAIVHIKEGKDIKSVPCSDQPKDALTRLIEL